jgi:hypothetical protein
MRHTTMRQPRIAGTALAVLALAALGGAQTRAQSYGDGLQTLTVGAGAFEGRFQYPDVADGRLDADGYLYYDLGGRDWLAPLDLPDGALIQQICLYANDPSADTAVVAWIDAVEISGQHPLAQSIGGVTSSLGSGYGYACSSVTYRIRDTADIDGDGLFNRTSYWVVAETQPTMGLGAVQIVWKREVSPPPASPTFGDVPATDGAWPHIEALAASGITSGCGGASYCPDATLTRRQMAVFLAKALGLHWTD